MRPGDRGHGIYTPEPAAIPHDGGGSGVRLQGLRTIFGDAARYVSGRLCLAALSGTPQLDRINCIPMIINRIHNIRVCVAAIIAAFGTACPATVSAFSADRYAGSSVLSEGKWVKVSVDRDGVYFVSAATLRQWGFDSPEAVNVYGYGGRRLSDILAEDFIDDLPQLQAVHTQAGIYFYALGPMSKRYRGECLSPVNNPFTTVGYYYLSDRDAVRRDIPTETSDSNAGDAMTSASTFEDMAFHEVDAVSPGEIGHLLLGEDFKYTRSQSFTIETPGRVEGTRAMLEASFVTCTSSSGSWLTYSVNGNELPRESNAEDRVTPVSDSYTYGYETLSRKEFIPSGTRMTVGVQLNATGTVSMANLNYLAITYSRLAALDNGALTFTSSAGDVLLGGASASTHILDVTDPLDIKAIKGVTRPAGIAWEVSDQGERTFTAFDESATLPTPKFVGNVANQNIHGMDTPDMVIITVDDWAKEAERLAEHHRTSSDSLKVLVIPQSLIYNEFSSGSGDVNALRKMLKMFYDRPAADGTRLRYCLLMGRATSDNRRLSSEGKSLAYTPMPTWLSDTGLNQNSSYTTDDVFAFLEDNSGRSFSSDKLSIAIGRLPVKSVAEARSSVDKIIAYSTAPKPGEWRNRVLMIADDEDYGVHMKQADAMQQCMIESDGGTDMMYNKLYIDQYERSNSTYPEARDKLFRSLDEGIIWWNYTGHANPTSWTHDGLMTYTDINSLYLKYQPFVYAATCDFMRWDCAQVSGAEILFLNEGSGTIGAISATRPVYISDNGVFSQAVGRYAFARREDGRRYTIGEIIQMAKNNYMVGGNITSNSNKLRYVLLGDPAMHLAIPDATVSIDSIAGEPAGNPDNMPVIKARQHLTVTGHVTDSRGNAVTGYDGTVHYTMYDAEFSTTSLGNGEKGEPVTFEQQGSRLVAGRGLLNDGRFTLDIQMPSEIADNYRPAALNIFVDGGTTDNQAVTNYRDFYVYDTDWDAEADTVAPVIESMYLNNPSFADGDIVCESPVLFATVSDNRALNMSQAGIGHQMLLTLDGGTTYTDVSNFYTPADDGSPSGTIAYPLADLNDGMHDLRLRVWDTSSNSAVRTVSFGVDHAKTPVLYDIYTDANPASVQANFYLVHDRPDQMIQVTISVCNMLGKEVWSTTTTMRSDIAASTPVTWDLTDNAGRRVRRGIYLYRATVSVPGIDGSESNTAAKRIAVTGG